MDNKKELIIDKIEKYFYLNSENCNCKLKVLEEFSMQINKGEVIGLLGPSGCGKSTLLNIVAGFDKQDQGTVLFRGKPISMPSPQRGVVFQSGALFPWLTVKENIAYGLKLKKEEKKTIEKECEIYIHLVGLVGFENYYPNQLSGGMQQRVALARVLVLRPDMLLMDEPFGALDAQTRIAMQQLLLSISSKVKSTILFVTHDVEEALILADRVYIMSRLPGKIVQEIKVPFKKPRPVSIFTNHEFTNLKSNILKMLNEDIFI
ncbi:MAG: ABC transporter ATP-binding protein [Anaerovorax sp.]|nr:ABC transporter ATP-binding protein [Anaerovorax sp.]